MNPNSSNSNTSTSSSFHNHQQHHHHQQPVMISPVVVSNKNNNHGKKPSLAGFDPFSSEQQQQQQQQQQQLFTAARTPKQFPRCCFPMGIRDDSSPTNQNKQPPTPTSAVSISPAINNNILLQNNNNNKNKNNNNNTPKCGKNANQNENQNNNNNNEKFDNEKTIKTSRRPMVQKVNKFFLRKSSLVKSLSLGKGVGMGMSMGSASTTTSAPDESSNDMAHHHHQQQQQQDKDDLIMDLKNKNKDKSTLLQIPSLAKLSPTSFLTGKEDEAVRTTYCGDDENNKYEPSPFQLEIPSLSEVVTIARLNEFVDNYRRQDQNLDLRQFVGFGLNKMQLQHRIDNNNNNNNKHDNMNTIVKEHVPIVQSLLECAGDDKDGEISLQGFLSGEEGDHHHYYPTADERTEAVIFQGQRHFTVVFRGTTEQQNTKILGSGGGNCNGNNNNGNHGNHGKSKKRRAVPLDDPPSSSTQLENNNNNNNNNNNVLEVYSGFKDGYSKLEQECFKLVDKLVDDNPFCDVVFSGYSFGAAMATLAAFRYATARPMMRVGCVTLASPKVGFSHFRHAVNSLPNLKVMRLELGQDAKCQGPTVGGCHVGHTLVLNTSSSTSSSSNAAAAAATATAATGGTSSAGEKSDKSSSSVSVYKFETPKHKSGFFKTANPGLKKYISTLEDLASTNKSSSSSSSWAKDFANNSGKGVVVNNEKRQMV